MVQIFLAAVFVLYKTFAVRLGQAHTRTHMHTRTDSFVNKRAEWGNEDL